MFKKFAYSLCVTVFLLAGCASKPPVYSGIRFPATNKTQVVFQEKDVPAQCQVFSHLIVHTPAGLSGARIGEAISNFSQNIGADLIFIGLSRKTSEDTDKDIEFFSYGPQETYKFGKDWFGWKFGYADWEKGGNVIGFGYESWHDTSGKYDFNMKIQAVLLRCEAGSPIKAK